MAKRKTNEEFISELELKRGNEYTPLETYKGNQTKIKILHNECKKVIEVRPKDLLVNGVKCSYCSGNTKFSIEDMRKFIEVDSNSGCKLLSKNLQNNQSKISLRCLCGNEFVTKFSYFKHENKRQCNDCGRKNRNSLLKHSYEYVNSFIESEGYLLLSEKYINNATPLEMKCNKNHVIKQTFGDFKGGHKCSICSYEELSSKSRLDFSKVFKVFEDEGYVLLSDDYRNSKTKLDLICPNKHRISMTYDYFKSGNRCKTCYLERKRENATSHIFVWLREEMKEWKVESMRNCSYKCVITNEPMDVVHHVYSFNLIAKETLSSLYIPILESITDYSDNQLSLMKNKCIVLHNKYGLGVCLTKEIHKLYHNLYGYINNLEQFEEFKVRYKNGEFNHQFAL